MPNRSQRQQIARASYSFATDGGAVGAVTLSTSDILPVGAIITGVFVDCTTGFTSGGSATVAVTGGGATLVSAATLSSLGINSTLKGKLTLASSATAIKATSNAPIGITVAVAALTAGVMDIFVEYIIK